MRLLTVYIMGPKASDTKIFLGRDLVGGILKFEFKADSKKDFSTVSFSCPFINLKKSYPPEIQKDTIRIIYGPFQFDPGYLTKNTRTNLCLGEDTVGMIKNISFESSVFFPYNKLKIKLSAHNDVFEKFPDWVEIEV